MTNVRFERDETVDGQRWVSLVEVDRDRRRRRPDVVLRRLRFEVPENADSAVIRRLAREALGQEHKELTE